MALASSSPLVTVEELVAAAPDDAIRIVDTRWKLGAPNVGVELFEAGHIPGAVHLDMDRDLAAPPGFGGRHPLPPASAFAASLSSVGVDANTTVVAYDDGDGMGAARLWWLLRHFGHDKVVVLDGGFQAWKAQGKPVEEGPGEAPEPRAFEAHPRADDFVDLEHLRAEIAAGEAHLLDARTPERWRGDVEPVDAIPGRIAGAINAPAGEHVRKARFRAPEELRAYYAGLGVLDGKPIVASCGSGVSACVNLLGLELAGVHGARLYPGSYSEWIARGLPVQTGS